MKRNLLLFIFCLLIIPGFLGTFADYLTDCPSGSSSRMVWSNISKPNQLPKCAPGDNNVNEVLLGNLGIGNHSIRMVEHGTGKDFQLSVYWDNKFVSKYIFPETGYSWKDQDNGFLRYPLGISQNGQHYMYVITRNSQQFLSEKERQNYFAIKGIDIIGYYIDGVKVTDKMGFISQDSSGSYLVDGKKVTAQEFDKESDSRLFYNKELLGFYFGLDNEDIDGKYTTKHNESSFPLTQTNEQYLDTFITTVTPKKRDVYIPLLKKYFQNKTLNYKKRVAAYYLYSELLIQKLKENGL